MLFFCLFCFCSICFSLYTATYPNVVYLTLTKSKWLREREADRCHTKLQWAGSPLVSYTALGYVYSSRGQGYFIYFFKTSRFCVASAPIIKQLTRKTPGAPDGPSVIVLIPFGQSPCPQTWLFFYLVPVKYNSILLHLRQLPEPQMISRSVS